MAMKLLGVTATPTRLSGEGLGDVFDTMILGPTTQELTDQGLLSPVRVFAPPSVSTAELHIRAGDFIQSESAALMDKPKITGDAVTHYRKYADGLPFIAFTCSLAHGEHVAADFRANGISALLIHGQMDRHTRKGIVNDYRNKKLTGLISVDLVGEGFDIPGIHCGIFLRPTASKGLWIQEFGRILRIAEGKSVAIALDHAGNTARHGLPTDPQNWTLAGTDKARRKAAQDAPVNVRICPQCFAASSARATVCRECGQEFKVEGRQVEEVSGELVEIQRKEARREQGRADTLEALIEIGRARGYANPGYWARKVFEGRRRA